MVTTSMRRNDVASTSFRRRVPTRFLINQCQIITFLILKYDIIENSRIDLRGIVLPVQVGGLLGGQRVCWPPLSNYWGGLAPPPLAPPSSYAYVPCFIPAGVGHRLNRKSLIKAGHKRTKCVCVGGEGWWSRGGGVQEREK